MYICACIFCFINNVIYYKPHIIDYIYIYIRLYKNTYTSVTGTRHIPSVALPFPFRFAGKVQARGTSPDEVLVANLANLPFPFRYASKTASWLNAVSCHRLEMLTNPAQQTHNAALAKSIHREMDRGDRSSARASKLPLVAKWS